MTRQGDMFPQPKGVSGERFLRGVQFLVMIPKDLLEILVCPACKQPLEYRENPESLKCTQCRRVYAVKDDIPMMLIDEATIEA
jgi:LSD1 subclass zinc finger protein